MSYSVACDLRIAHRTRVGFTVMVLLIHLVSQPALSQQTNVLLNDAKALVTQVDVSPGAVYDIPQEQGGSIWIAVDPIVLITSNDGVQTKKQIDAGEAELVRPGEELHLSNRGDLHARLIVMKSKGEHQNLTIGRWVLETSIEDASDRNATLLIAISSCHFSDTRNLGDESEWTPSKPDIVAMHAGNVRWIRPGIHHFKNLGPTVARLVSIEW